MYVTLCEAKKHLLVDNSFKDDDEYILALIDIAEDAVSININIPLDSITVGGELPPAVNKVPYTFDYLISLYKNYSTK